MEWVNDFYRKQYNLIEEITGKALLDITEHHLKQVEIVKEICRESEGSILELGAGCGQFAVAAAKSGYDITAIEIAPNAVNHMKKLADQYSIRNLEIIEESFYEAPLAQQYDIVCYWDGFGIGSDKEQKFLLRRIYNWLKPKGVALIDIYTPWYWPIVNGMEMDFGNVKRRYGFDAKECRMLDTWWLKREENKSVTQSLRCYSPADISLLLEGTGLRLEGIEAGGGVQDYKTLKYEEKVPLGNSMIYRIQLVKEI